MKVALAILASVLTLGETSAQDVINLPAPRKTGGMPVMEALARRATSRAFDPKPLTSQQLSDALWAAFGVNRTRRLPLLLLRGARDRREVLAGPRGPRETDEAAPRPADHGRTVDRVSEEVGPPRREL